MKNIFKYLFGLVALAMFAACTPETFEGANGDIPTLDGIEPVVSVDQNLNQVTLSLPDNVKGCMPVWILYDENDKVVYSTVNGLKKIYTLAGTYRGEFKLMNRNGISDGSKEFTFTMDNSIVNYDKYLTLLCGAKENSSKEWRIDNDKAGHLGCGQPATTGLDWWSAGANEKEGYGVYDCRLTFSADYKYNFNPGESGQIYVNKDVVALGGPQGEDFCVDATEQTVDYKFETKGNDLYIVFPQHTFFPYIANDDIWNEPRYKVESITSSEINLVIDNGGIAWHYILTSGAAAVKFSGFKYDSEFNLWKPVDDNSAFTTHFWYAPGWNQIADPEFSKDGNAYTFHLPEATTDQWMAQCPLKPNEGVLHLSANATYDMSCIISSDADIKGVTVKLTDVNSGDNFVFAERVDVAAYEDKVFYVSGVNELSADCDCELFFDFGGNPANTTVTVKNIVIKDHANDDGTVLPSDEPGDQGGVNWVDVDSPQNLMTSGELTLASCWWANNDWGQIADPNVAINGRNVTITATEANGGQQWQGQVHLNTGVAIEEGKTYDFSITMNPSQPLAGATVKPHPEGDDGHFFSEGRHDLEGFTDNVVTYENFTADFSTGNLVITLDFPGCDAGTTIDVTKIIIQEHQAAGGNGNWVDVNSADNLFSAATFVLNSNWWANNDWGQIDDPVVVIDGRTAKITATVANGGQQWQGQCHFGSGVAMQEGVTYDFSITLNPTQNLSGATVKPHPAGDDGHFISEGRHDLTAYEDNVVTYVGFVSDFTTSDLVITLDFPGCDAGTEIEVKDIILQVHK